MPKETFFRLPEEKRTRLIKAAYSEFARQPFNTASIANIIKDAGIPRGSFYQYFEDKADVFFYLLEQMQADLARRLRAEIAANQGAFFPALTTVFNQIIDEMVLGPYADFYANVFTYMDFHSVSRLTPPQGLPKHHPHHKGEMTAFLLEHVDRSQLRVDSDDDMRMLIRQTMGLFMQTLGYYYNRRKAGESVSIDELKKHLAQLLNWIQYGVVKGSPPADAPV